VSCPNSLGERVGKAKPRATRFEFAMRHQFATLRSKLSSSAKIKRVAPSLCALPPERLHGAWQPRP
jgi:hypothetical protein